ncbi:unnamed protein product, partial [marine sediment metagenome]
MQFTTLHLEILTWLFNKTYPDTSNDVYALKHDANMEANKLISFYIDWYG